MNNIDLDNSCWPTEQQELLLKAALLKGTESVQSWEKWIDSTDVNAIDIGSQRLLPLLMMNLHSQGISHPILSKFKGVYRQTWYRNQMLFHEIATVIRLFQQNGIETMILKGAALVVDYYKDPGLRPMDDFDLLVPTSKIVPAINQLRTLIMWKPKKRLDLNNPWEKEFPLISRSGNNLDLHCHILFETPQQDADKDFWEAAIPTSIGNTPTLALNPTDQLLHTLVHGLRWNQVPSLRWIADTNMILSSKLNIDWDRLIFQSKKNEVLLVMKETLQYMAGRMNAPVPSDVLNRVQHFAISYDDRIRYHLITITHNDKKRARFFNHSFSVLGYLPIYWYIYSHHFARTSSWLRGLWGFPSFLQHLWKLNNLMLVPFYAIGKGIRQFRNRLLDLRIN